MNNKVEEIKAFIPIYSVIFLCTGIFYNYIYLGHFGIDIAKFFNLNDYLATSIDKIILNLFPIVASSLVFLFPMMKPNADEVASFKISELSILLAFCLPGIILLALFNDPRGYYIIGISLDISIAYIVSRSVLRGPTRIRELFYLTFLLFFISGVWANAMVSRFRIENYELSKIKKYHFTFENKADDTLLIDDTTLALLAANSNYYFFYDKKNRKSFIIPLKKVVAIEVRNGSQQQSINRDKTSIAIEHPTNAQHL